MEKFEQGRVSENEDDPDVYESSGDEWNEEVEERLSKKPRVSHVDLSSEEDGTGKKKKSKNGIKRQKMDPEQEEDVEEEEDDVDEEEEEEEEDDSADSGQPNNKTSKKSGKSSDFVNGGFLILKKDAQKGDPSKKPCLWRIDGKALLQKYEPFDEEGQVRHRNTSIYTGWSSLDKEMYYPVTVKVLQHQGQNMTVELNWEKLKELQQESE
ncbi:acidic leucine-rich nuclear phosphoprotein 32 family member B-like isoform X2 [Photinus pyralis]|uniref:Uncharacterized protein n=1 Tax=Photinus pyralis TaxID=7054 RepID=A0A1Y1L6X0_PHOPY|nr:acidic leucine-rich nuclear phosphoprotein 32 family member B-like isoform X2 [Photinus pyralis]XP_031357427.1 acidic leucine-rich nuclear phosphoprotein 32 family member B-like isoform X2 [Photinus pyralis]